MKVLVHLNHGADRSVMFNFGRNLNKRTLSGLLKNGVEETVESLTGYAMVSGLVKMVEIPFQKIKRAEQLADATINQHGAGSVSFA